jgi:hypothetical protein
MKNLNLTPEQQALTDEIGQQMLAAIKSGLDREDVGDTIVPIIAASIENLIIVMASIVFAENRKQIAESLAKELPELIEERARMFYEKSEVIRNVANEQDFVLPTKGEA